MEGLRVSETTKQKDNGERPQESIRDVIEYHAKKGKLLEGTGTTFYDQKGKPVKGKMIKDIVIPIKESNERIKVYLQKKKWQAYHIGYIQKSDLKSFKENFKIPGKYNAEFFEYSIERTALDDKGDTYVRDVIQNIEVYIYPQKEKVSENKGFLARLFKR